MAKDWFRNTTWDENIERNFDEMLHRARDKHQPLRIQAYMLVNSKPEVALKLLDRYFKLPINFDLSEAYHCQATAYLTLDRVDEAISSYEAALDRETSYPNYLTQSLIDLPYLIATRYIREKYNRALQLLQISESRLRFPVDRFRWHASPALIAADLQQLDVARLHAKCALDAAALEHSGFRYHPSVGLVTEHYEKILSKMKALNNKFSPIPPALLSGALLHMIIFQIGFGLPVLFIGGFAIYLIFLSITILALFLSPHSKFAYFILTKIAHIPYDRNHFQPIFLPWWRYLILIINLCIYLAPFIFGLWFIFTQGFCAQNFICLLLNH